MPDKKRGRRRDGCQHHNHGSIQEIEIWPIPPTKPDDFSGAKKRHPKIIDKEHANRDLRKDVRGVEYHAIGQHKADDTEGEHSSNGVDLQGCRFDALHHIESPRTKEGKRPIVGRGNIPKNQEGKNRQHATI